jgi:hypothetical protein
MITLSFQIVPHGSQEYDEIVNLRQEILRKPLNMFFQSEDLPVAATHRYARSVFFVCCSFSFFVYRCYFFN